MVSISFGKKIALLYFTVTFLNKRLMHWIIYKKDNASKMNELKLILWWVWKAIHDHELTPGDTNDWFKYWSIFKGSSRRKAIVRICSKKGRNIRTTLYQMFVCRWDRTFAAGLLSFVCHIEQKLHFIITIPFGLNSILLMDWH